MGSDTSLIDTNEANATQLFEVMKTSIHMARHRQGETHPFHWSNAARHWWGEGGTSVRVNEISVYIWLDNDEAKVILFISTSHLHPTWRQHCYDWVSAIHKPPSYIDTSNTLHEYMMTIARSLSGGFLQTHSVDVFNRTSLFHKAPRTHISPS
jgi:hypothetical protein